MSAPSHNQEEHDSPNRRSFQSARWGRFRQTARRKIAAAPRASWQGEGGKAECLDPWSSRAVDYIDLSPDLLMGVIVVLLGIPVYLWLARQRAKILNSDGQFRSRWYYIAISPTGSETVVFPPLRLSEVQAWPILPLTMSIDI